MPGHQYKDLFDRVNESRKRRGDRPLSWPEFLGKEPKSVYREKIKMLDHVEKDEPKKIQRPPAVYDNHSVREKYGL
jgi:hypothetical protein